MITRSIGKVLRGKATPVQLALACILGSILGFLPGYADGAVFLHAPALVLTLIFALMILNANLPLAGMVGVLAKLVSLAIMPLNFAAGRLLLDGPTQPLFQKAINAPVLALFGLEYYATTGALLMGLIFGLIMSVLVVGLLRSFRGRMARLEEGSEAYKRYTSKKWVKVLVFVFVGGRKGKRTYAELNQKRVGNPIRPLGVVAAVLLLGLAMIVNALARDEIVTATLRRGLEIANGATVDVEQAQLDLRGGKLVVTGLAMADPEALETDLFRAGRLEADISGRDLLRKRIALDQMVATDAYTGENRRIPGRLTGRPGAPRPAPEPRQPGEKTLEDYIADAQQWKDRLQQLKRWIDKMETQREPDVDPTGRPLPRETLRERLAREVREKGYTRVAAEHLVEGAPTVLIRELLVEGLRSQPLAGRSEPEILDVRAENVSTHPWLVDEPTKIVIRSRSESLSFDAMLNSLSAAGGESSISMAYRGMPADHISRQLRVKDPQPLKGGTVDFTANGILGYGGRIHLPFEVTVLDTTVAVPKLGSSPVSRLVVPVGVTGRLDDPRILWDGTAFADALAQAGAAELAGKVRAEAQAAIDKAKGELTAKAEEQVAELKEQATAKLTEAAGEKLSELTGDKKDEVAEKLEEKVGEEVKRVLPGLLNRRRDDPNK